MRVAVGVLTHNVFTHDRQHLLLDTLRSLKQTSEPFDLYIVDNASTDGTQNFVEQLGGYASKTMPSTCGHGMNVTLDIISANADLCVFSNDDIAWKPGYLETLKAFWSDAPNDLLICSGHLEPEYPWNTPREVVQHGGIKALVRDTAPGGTWTFRAKHRSVIGRIPETAGIDDVPTCERLRASGYRVAQMDVATHAGEDKSSWGNGSYMLAKPLDPKWGMGG